MTITNGVKNKTLMPGVTPIADVVDAPTIGTATAGIGQATVPFTAAVTGGTATSFTAISTPGSVTGSSATSPITVSGLTADTGYTFKVFGANASGTWSAVQSAASNSVTVLGTAFESIATTTLSTDTATVTFSSIPGTYAHLQLRCLIRSNRTIGDGADLKIKFNGSSTDYAFHDLSGDGASATAAAGTSAVAISLQRIASDNTAGSNIFAGMVIDILDYTSTSKNKTVRSLGGYDRNGAGQISLSSGLWYASPAAITSIELTSTATTSFKQYTQFALYGIKGA